MVEGGQRALTLIDNAFYRASMVDRHIVTLQVNGRPATFATAHEAAWKQAVRDAVGESGSAPQEARFAVRTVFRLGPSRTASEVWDIDNLIKPTLDAMEGIFGLRQWRGPDQVADDRVDRVEAEKRPHAEGVDPGATIDVWVIE